MFEGAKSQAQLRGGLGSRVGRRIFVLFVGCSLVPLALFAWLALSEVSSELSDEADRQMRRVAKSTGITVAERLLLLSADLEQAALELERFEGKNPSLPSTTLETRLSGRFSALFLQSDRAHVALHGTPLPLPELSESQRKHLAAGKQLLLSVPRRNERTEVALLREMQTGPRDRMTLVGVVRPEQLWEIEGVRPQLGMLLVRDAKGEVLFESDPGVFPLDQLQAALASDASSGRLEWDSAEGRLVGRYWRLFVRPRFHVDWILTHARQKSYALATLRNFRFVFTWTAVLSFLVVTILSLMLIRRTLGPIRSLREATRRVAEGDLQSQVEIHTRDEFGELGDSFNHMTRELLEYKEELVQARDEALAAARVEAELVSNVSHELRTPLTSILSFGEILQQFGDDDPGTRDEFLGIIVDQARHLTKVVDQMLQLSRLQNGEEQWTIGQVDVARWVQQTIQDLPPEQRGRIVVQFDEGLPPVAGDSAHLTHVWYHLIDNALKFSPEEEQVFVRAYRSEEELVFEVEDRGIGIAPENHGAIFERFRQVDRDYLTDKAAGTGLGLALVRDVVLRHRGKVEVNSARGEGALLRVRLPLAESLAPTPAPLV